MLDDAALVFLIFLAATLYSSVGHAGASGYLAAMALFGVAPETMKPAALVLNILVAAIATTRFLTAKAFSAQLFIPLVLTSAPFAFLGGAWTLSGQWYKILVAFALVTAAFRLALHSRGAEKPLVEAPLWQTLILGAAIGLLSGLTGVGGGIYLTPVILFAGWARPREASGVSAAFILVNSITGLAGRWQAAPSLPPQIPYWAAAALCGGLLGSHLGVKRLSAMGLRRALSAVLVVAAIKLIYS
ncbi:MAG TPA: sulfite exporter TauE/SafE family protein [Fimbriimonadales bacterium]|nr:sulfite exporter TauE/SafE family protein [Fimbriimonadales bacterium]